MSNQDHEAVLAAELHKIAPDVEVADIDQDADLREEFDIDSMDFLNLVTALSQHYGISIPEADYPRLSSFAGCVSYLEAQSVPKGT